MAWLCSGKTNAELISNLRNQGLITSNRVAEVGKSIKGPAELATSL